MEQSDFTGKIRRLEANIGSVIKGKPEIIKTAIVALLSRSHMLIEDVPGVGKTTLAHALARSTDLSFKRIQFTSDLLPSDILGVSVLEQSTGNFIFKPGPIFANIVLADEINRATPKTQSALLEAMNEAKVTMDGTVRDLPKPFMVIATQNPFEYKGTFPLPENQLDRFAMRIGIGYPDRESERRILSTSSAANSWESINPVISKEEVVSLQELSEKVRTDDSILDYILAIVTETRKPEMFELGVSPRGALALKSASQSHALTEGRTYCTPEDVKTMAVPVLAHRVIIRNERNMGTGGEEEAIEDVLRKVKVPI